jgi:hypothetical protein
MMLKSALLLALVALAAAQPTPDVTPMDYEHEGVELQGFYAEPESFEGRLPAVVIIPCV